MDSFVAAVDEEPEEGLRGAAAEEEEAAGVLATDDEADAGAVAEEVEGPEVEAEESFGLTRFL